MKILYTTDLHGRQHYYNQIWKMAVKYQVDIVINGGDMLPKTNPVFKNQPSFIKNLEKHYWPRFERSKIHYLCCLGNDDLKIYDDKFDQACDQFEYVHNIAGRCIKIQGLEFIGFSLVCDYCFELKDRCRRDRENFVFPVQNGPGCFSSTKNGGSWEDIEDWISLAQNIPTIEEELAALPKPKDMSKAIYVAHLPPAGVGLDVCADKNRAESKAMFSFLETRQPMLSLHGHIHESFRMTGIWKAKIGQTIAVQPGQGGFQPVFVIIDTDDLSKMDRHGHDTETLMIKAYAPTNGRIPYIRISELPEYLREPFWDSLAGQGQTTYPGEKWYNTPYAHDFESFCYAEGIKIKLIKTSIN
jgi:Icc-related predicted phosphoesterase